MNKSNLFVFNFRACPVAPRGGDTGTWPADLSASGGWYWGNLRLSKRSEDPAMRYAPCALRYLG